MIELGSATEHEMIAAFLQAEIHSSRFQKYLFPPHYHGCARALIEAPDFNDATANAERRALLAYRGYPGRLLFTGFPPNVAWSRVRLEPQDFVQMRYANEPSLIALSGMSRLVSDGAKNFAAGVPAAAPMEHVKGIISALRAGNRFPPLIAAADTDGSLILIEGHSRATAYMVTGLPDNLEAFAARAPSFTGWHFY
jgi:hypothetical protein